MTLHRLTAGLLVAVLAAFPCSSGAAQSPWLTPTDAHAGISVLAANDAPAEALLPPQESDSQKSTFYQRYIAGKLSIGTRSAYRFLTDDDSGAKGRGQGEGTFLGTIYALDEKQNVLPLRPFISYFFSDYIGLELAYDCMEAETRATPPGFANDKSDGDVALKGVTLSMLARYRNSSRFTPYLGIGAGFFKGSFDEDPAWRLGYPHPDAYAALGSPSSPLNGRYRSMEVDDTIALVATVGVSCRISGGWSLDLSGQYFKADADATFQGYSHGVLDTWQTGSFPMDNLSVRLGLSYTF